jgi:membrane associated rhomboid family serine protease
MGIYSRSYMQDHPAHHSNGPWALKGILIVLAVIFILQNILRHWLGSSFLEEYFALSLQGLSSGWIHTLLTYGFLHSTERALPWHLILNGFMLYWFGREFQDRAGSKHFLECFLFCIFTGGLMWAFVHLFTPGPSGVIGASSGVFGILALFCRYRWMDTMMLLFIPIRFNGQQLFWALVGIQGFFLLFSEIPGNLANSTAYSAHLGGIIGAILYEKYRLHKASFLERFTTRSQPRPMRPAWQKRADASRAAAGRFSVNLSRTDNLKQEVDRILDKINEQGFGSLSTEEKAILEKARGKF